MNGTEVWVLSGRPQGVGWKPSIPKERAQRSLRSMGETQKMGYQTERKKQSKEDRKMNNHLYSSIEKLAFLTRPL